MNLPAKPNESDNDGRGAQGSSNPDQGGGSSPHWSMVMSPSRSPNDASVGTRRQQRLNGAANE